MTDVLGAPGPRVLVLGDSWVRGLSKGKNTISRLVPQAMGSGAVLDLSKISRVTTDIVAEHLDEIDRFAPEVALLAIGGADSLIFPARWIQRLIDRVAPPDWQGVEGLQPLAMYARDRGKRLRQQTTVFAKALLKQVVINLLGARRRVPLAQYESAAQTVLERLARHGTVVVLVGFPDVEGWKSPKTTKSVHRANRVSQRLIADQPLGLYVETRNLLRKWDDYLPDGVHLALCGHRTVTAGILAAMVAAGGPWADLVLRPDLLTVGVAAEVPAVAG